LKDGIQKEKKKSSKTSFLVELLSSGRHAEAISYFFSIWQA